MYDSKLLDYLTTELNPHLNNRQRINFLLSLHQSFRSLEQLRDIKVVELCRQFHQISPAAILWFLRNSEIDLLRVGIQDKLDHCEKLGINFLMFGEADYPMRLKRKMQRGAPLYLSYLGNRDLLDGTIVGIVGRRDSALISQQITSHFIKGFAGADICIASGGARGIDWLSHVEALKADLPTIVVVAQGLAKYLESMPKILHDAVENDSALILSPFFPDSEWMTSNAFYRSALLISICKVLVAMEIGDTGGTMQTARNAILMKTPLFIPHVLDGDGCANANQRWIQEGGIPIHVSNSTNNLEIDLALIKSYLFDSSFEMELPGNIQSNSQLDLF